MLGDSPHLALVLRDDFAQPAPAPTEAVIALGKSMAAPLQTLVANDLQLGPDQPVPATATLNELFARKGAAALSHVVGCIAKEFGATPANAADMTLADLAKVIGSARRRQWVGCAMGFGRCGPAIRAFLQDLEGAAEHALNGTLDTARHPRRAALAGRLRPAVEKGALNPSPYRSEYCVVRTPVLRDAHALTVVARVCSALRPSHARATLGRAPEYANSAGCRGAGAAG